MDTQSINPSKRSTRNLSINYAEKVTSLKIPADDQWNSILSRIYVIQPLPYTNPKTYREAMSRPDSSEWRDACDSEFHNLIKYDVFEAVHLPRNAKLLQTRWVFTTKSSGMKKARFVAKGYSQKPGEDYTEVFSPVADY